jgi:hypothetical protein
MNSLASALNMDYVHNYIPNDGYSDTDTTPIIRSIRENYVRTELKSIGYTDIAFNMGYKWATWWDADIYLPEFNILSSLTAREINSFEMMYVATTMLKPWIDRGIIGMKIGEINLDQISPYRDHYERVQYILDTIPTFVSSPGPKLVFVHLMVPHPPFVFLPDGSFNQDTNYYEMWGFEGKELEYAIQGYLNGVQFINHRMMDLVDQIQLNSDHPPIIILQSDHGYLLDEGKYNILNAYYLPDGGDEFLYNSISPINTFRLVFNYYFGADFAFIEDISISTDIGHPFSDKEVPATTCPE